LEVRNNIYKSFNTTLFYFLSLKKDIFMSTAEIREQIKKQIDTVDDELLHEVNVLLGNEYPNWVYQKLNDSIAQADAGNTIPHDEVMKKYR
jgi:hypothetical protein